MSVAQQTSTADSANSGLLIDQLNLNQAAPTPDMAQMQQMLAAASPATEANDAPLTGMAIPSINEVAATAQDVQGGLKSFDESPVGASLGMANALSSAQSFN